MAKAKKPAKKPAKKVAKKPAKKAAPKKAAPKKSAAKKAPAPKRAKHVPKGTQSVIAYLHIEGLDDALDFYPKAFGGTEQVRLNGPDGKAMHGEIELEGCRVYMGEASPERGARSPKQLGGNSSGMMVYVANCDANIKRAVEAGCKLLMAAQDMFWGDRMGQVADPFGHTWTFATHLREPSAAEIMAAMEKMGG